jgi:hypothetical protein
MRILVDTPIWAGHLARPNARLRHLVDVGLVVVHPYVRCELALGDLGPKRGTLLLALAQAPRAPEVPVEEVYGLIERERLERSGIGFVDAALLASAREGGLRLWTEDRALGAVATKLRVKFAA